MSYFFHVQPLVSQIKHALEADKLSYRSLSELMELPHQRLHDVVRRFRPAMPFAQVLAISNHFKVEFTSLVTNSPDISPQVTYGQLVFREDYFRQQLKERLSELKVSKEQVPLLAGGLGLDTMRRLTHLPLDQMTLQAVLGGIQFTTEPVREFFELVRLDQPPTVGTIRERLIALLTESSTNGVRYAAYVKRELESILASPEEIPTPVPSPVASLEAKPTKFEQLQDQVISRLKEVYPPEADTEYRVSILANLTASRQHNVCIAVTVINTRYTTEVGIRVSKEFCGKTSAEALKAFDDFIEETFFPHYEED